MKHARPDYDPIQDPRGLIPQDEPVFLLRAQDTLAPKIVEMWALAAHDLGAKPDIVQAAYEQSQAMRKWQEENGHKTPDMPIILPTVDRGAGI
jgi:hypothetical protein